ncbi:MAG: hypothetical protein WBE34_21090 [Candidatus Nitrosopolaris sp.]
MNRSSTAFNNGSRDIGPLGRIYSLEHSMTQMQRKETFLAKVAKDLSSEIALRTSDTAISLSVSGDND